METKIKIGISACLTGANVRYNGGHSRDPYIMDTLGRYLDFVPICPESECGLGTPREAMRLVGDPARPRLITIRSKRDLTEQMHTWAARRVQEMEKENLCGFIFKSRSPSSGMERVKVYSMEPDKSPQTVGVGLFARAFMDHFPLLPVEDEGRLHDLGLRELFITRIFVYQRWRQLLTAGRTRGGLVTFHTRHKLLFLAHNEKLYRRMGQLVADPSFSSKETFQHYEKLMMTALSLKSTPAKNTNVLLHMMGYFKKQLSADEKQELLEIIDQYRNGHVPLIVPISLVNHYVRKYGQPYLADQYYLAPHPLELKLRNHA
ncbi:MAG: YbgA family protein [Thermodesulfobacteriota bacterium]